MPDRFTVTPDPASAGSSIRICFSNSALANTTINITVNNGGSSSVALQITLNGEGYGCVDWTVPETGWDSVICAHPSSVDHAVPVI